MISWVLSRALGTHPRATINEEIIPALSISTAIVISTVSIAIISTGADDNQ